MFGEAKYGLACSNLNVRARNRSGLDKVHILTAFNPEMLGKVIENLIEENLRRGLAAFYTRAQARRQPPVSGAPAT